MKVRRGFLLISALLITVILLTLGLSFLGKRSVQYRRVAALEASTQARELAESGLEDALLKLRRDIDFPPVRLDQTVFTYTEDVDFDATRLGGYQVSIDATYRQFPFRVLIIRSTGMAGSDPNQPTARRTVQAEFDIDPTRATYYQLINYQDLGGL